MPSFFLPKTALLAYLLLSLGACSTVTGQQPGDQSEATLERLEFTDTSDPEEFGPSPEESGVNPTQFSRDNLYDLLVAEVAARRQAFNVVLENYSRVATRTRDHAVVTRTYGIAQYLKDDQTISEMTYLWAEIEPENLDVQQQLAFEQVKNGDFAAALLQMEKVLEMGGDTSFDRIALQARSLPPEEQAEVKVLYEKVLERHPDNGELRYGYAVLQELTGDLSGALKTAQEQLQKTPEKAAIITLMAGLLSKTGGNEAAIEFLTPRQDLLLKDPQLGNFYGRILIEGQRLDEAETVYRDLSESFPDATHLKLALGLVALENQNLDEAASILRDLILADQHTNEAHFYLARIAEIRENSEEAIAEYRQVNSGANYFNALARAGFLLHQRGEAESAQALFHEARMDNPSQAEQIWELEINLYVELEQFAEALALTDRALQEYPASHNLLYSRAMLKERQGDLQGMESDLREILAEDPENAVALNALGYTLADRNQRLEEAAGYIQTAYELDPDNPAIIDSMGWVRFRLGQLEEALKWIREAYARYPDPEVGAHLGEILWSMGRRDEALAVFQRHHDEEPDHRILKNTLERLNIELD